MAKTRGVPAVEILLATYNGREHIATQLESLLAQTYSNFEVLVADDGSTDGTLQVVERYLPAFEGRLRVESFSAPAGGAAANFWRLMQRSRAQRVMFCDQDDLWFPDKIALSLDALAQVETYAVGKPVLVHTDLSIADDQLRVLARSLFGYQNLPKSRGFRGLLVQNNVTGCTAVANRALVEIALLAKPSGMIMHDWWLALVAAAFGVIRFLDHPTMLYRQHSANAIGAKRWGAGFVMQRAGVLTTGGATSAFRRLSAQAAAFASIYSDRLSPQDYEAVSFLATIEHYPPLDRRLKLIRYGMLKYGVVRNAALMLLI